MTLTQNYTTTISTEVNKFYKKVDDSLEKALKRDAKVIVTEIKTDDRITKLHKQQAFVTIQNHMENFLNNPQ